MYFMSVPRYDTFLDIGFVFNNNLIHYLDIHSTSDISFLFVVTNEYVFNKNKLHILYIFIDRIFVFPVHVYSSTPNVYVMEVHNR